MYNLYGLFRNILLQHSRALPSNAKKAELVNEFIAGVLPLKQAILKAQSKVKSSSAGITIMGEPHLDEPVVSRMLVSIRESSLSEGRKPSKLTSLAPRSFVPPQSPVRRRKSRQSLAAQAQAQEEAEDGEDEDPAQEEVSPTFRRKARRNERADLSPVLRFLPSLSSTSLPKPNDPLDDPQLSPPLPLLGPSLSQELERRFVEPGREKSSLNLPNRSRRRANPRTRSSSLCLCHRHLLSLRGRSPRRSTERALR